MKPTPTPRTEAAIAAIQKYMARDQHFLHVGDYARELEREIIRLRAVFENMKRHIKENDGDKIPKWVRDGVEVGLSTATSRRPTQWG